MNTVNLEQLLESLLATGKEYAEKGQAIAEQKLNIPSEGQEREVMLDGLKKGAIASAVLVGLLGTRAGRSLTGTAIKLGGLAALGVAAYTGYQNWQGDKQSEVVDVAGPSYVDSSLIIKAMVAAANADGKVDDDELKAIKHEILQMHLSDDDAQRLEKIIDSPLSAQELGNLADGDVVAAEIYLATRLLVDEHSSLPEKMFLEDLVVALGLSHELCAELDRQVA
ncbi:MAG: uncharacterized membrane protein YebE (DUF533 family) [Cryomorphaceae bacterium]|jgi:uncharacterized membrane protein YebE (DUF533 family)